MTRRIAIALMPAAVVFAWVFWSVDQTAENVEGWANITWMGIPGVLGIGVLATLVAAPVFLVALGVIAVAGRVRTA